MEVSVTINSTAFQQKPSAMALPVASAGDELLPGFQPEAAAIL